MVDVFGKNVHILKNKKLFLLDMDGTIYNENQLFDGTLGLLEQIKSVGSNYAFITNNSSKSVDAYLMKVCGLGIEATKDNFFTSVQATCQLLKMQYPKHKVYCQGTRSMIDEMRNAGIDVTEDIDEDADIVLVGFDTELTSEKLRKTCYMLGKDIVYLATNCDLRCPVEFGYIPDCGSICGMLENCTGKRPKYIGKPSSVMIDMAMEWFGKTKEETVVVGDRLYTDIASGNNAGVTSVCVLTGEATMDDVEHGDIKPTFTFRSIKDLYEAIK